MTATYRAEGLPAPTIVTPTRRAAYALRAEHDHARAAAGARAWPTPDILAFDDLLERMHVLDRRPATERRRCIPASLSQALWQAVIEADPQSGGMVFGDGLAPLAARAWQRLQSWDEPGPPSARFARQAEESVEASAFLRWARAYAAELARRGWIDEAQLPDRVCSESAPSALRLQGFARLTRQQTRWIERLRSTGRQVEVEAAGGVPGAMVVHALPDAASELEAALRWAAARLVEQPAARIAIVMPELRRQARLVRRAVDRVFDPAAGRSGGADPGSGHCQIAIAEDLLAEPLIGAAFELLAPWILPPELAVTGRFLRSPSLAGAELEAGARALLELRLRRDETPACGLSQLARRVDPERTPQLQRALEEGRSNVDKWPDKQLASHWANDFSILLSTLGWRAPSGDGRAQQALAQWRSVLVEFGAADELAGHLDAGQALGRLRHLVAAAPFHAQGPAAALTVIEADAAVGLRFDALWACGLEATSWPNPARPDPLLPRSWQQHVGLPGSNATVAESEARERLEALCASAGDVVLSWPRGDHEAMLLPSPLLQGLPVAAGEPARWGGDEDAERQRREAPALERLPEPGLPPLPGPAEVRGGARVLELQSACPFRAQAELRLDARPLAEAKQGIESSERGTFVHAALARLWGELRTQRALRALEPAQLSAAIGAAIEAALDVENRRTPRGVRAALLAIEAQWLRERIVRLLEADLARADFEVLGRELKQPLSLGPLRLNLQLDRIDRLADGSLAVIDYKTGASAQPTAWYGERPGQPQLPAYALAAAALGPVGAVAFGKLHVEKTAYVGVARDPVAFAGLKPPGKAYESWPALLAAWERSLGALAVEHASGDARLAGVPLNACRLCHLASLCRIGDAATDDGDDDGQVTDLEFPDPLDA